MKDSKKLLEVFANVPIPLVYVIDRICKEPNSFILELILQIDSMVANTVFTVDLIQGLVKNLGPDMDNEELIELEQTFAEILSDRVVKAL